MKKSAILVFATIVFLIVGAGTSRGGESCYELGYRWGMCAAKSLHGIPCKPENDIVIPARCRGKAETERGIKAGVKKVYEELGLDTGAAR